jgi:hypothetical protein
MPHILPFEDTKARSRLKIIPNFSRISMEKLALS